MSGTPETDQLDLEMRDQGQMTRASYYRNKCRDLERRLSEAIRERDRMQAALESQIDECKLVHGEAMNIVAARAETAEQERDELQAKLDSERTTRNYLIQRGGEVERERDDARAALREAIDTHERIAVEYGGTEGIAYKLNMERWRKAAGMEVQ